MFFFKWSLIATTIGILAGTASTLFLASLDFVTRFREQNLWIIIFLPIVGLGIGFAYHYLGQDINRGSNQLIDESISPTQVVPFKMAPFIFVATILTHLFGGSAGREGTGVQMGGTIADQLTHLLKLPMRDRKILLACGVGAGFASIFGTPLAGTLFALEVNFAGSIRYDALLPALIAALVADWFSLLLGVHHTQYHVAASPTLSFPSATFALIAGIAFGLCGRLFATLMHFISDQFKKYISFAPIRPFIGGTIVAAIVWISGTTRYIGLGIPTIVEAFQTPLPFYDFLAKSIMTTLTLGSGFKGGEVTPLFFIGATLGSTLSRFLMLPTDLLAAMGFVSVFAAATNTPLACLLMGIELFGHEHGVYLAVGCFTAYLFSGHTSIYLSQRVGSPKHHSVAHHTGTAIGKLDAIEKNEP